MFRLFSVSTPFTSAPPDIAEGTMIDLKGLYNLRHRMLKLGVPALVSRGTMAVWGIVNIFIIRVIPESAFASYALARTFEGLGLLIGGGFVQQAILKMASEGDGPREHELANAGILLTMILALFSAMVLTVFGGVADRFYSDLDLAGLPVLLAGVVVSSALVSIPRALLISRHRTRDVMYVDLLQFVVKGGIVVAFIATGNLRTAHQIFTAAIVAHCMAFLLSLLLAGRFFFPEVRLRPGTVRHVMSFSLICLGTATANYIYTSTDMMMLGKLAPDDVASYGAVRALTGVFAMVNAAANMILLPLFSRMWRQGQGRLIVSRIWSSVFIAELILLPVAVALVFFPGTVLDVLFRGKYLDGWRVMVVLGSLMLVRPVGSYFSTAALAMGKPQYSLYGVLASTVVNVLLNLLLIRSMGGLGAAVATFAAVVFGTVWVVRMTWSYIRRTLEARPL